MKPELNQEIVLNRDFPESNLQSDRLNLSRQKWES